MTLSAADFPQDIASCHVLIGQLLEERQQQEQVIQQQAARIAGQAASLHENEQGLSEQAETIPEYQATVERLMADLALLKRSLFGSRRERYVDDPRQRVLFDDTRSLAERPGSSLETKRQVKPRRSCSR